MVKRISLPLSPPIVASGRSGGQTKAVTAIHDPDEPLPSFAPATGPRQGLPGVTWGPREVAIGGGIVVLLFFILAMVVAAPLAAIFGEDSPESLVGQVATAGIWNLAMVYVVYRVVRSKGSDWSGLGLRRPGHPEVRWPVEKILGVIGGAYLLCLLNLSLYSLAIDLLGLNNLVPDQQVPDALYDHDWILAMFAVIGVTLVPFSEELFFRGFLFGGLRRRLPFLVAGLISGGLFSLAHFNLGLIVPFALVGLILCYVYERSGTLYTSIGVHALFNLVSFAILAFFPDARPS